MFNKFLFVLVVFIFFGCKKKYDCHCNTNNLQSGIINDMDYEIWEQNKSNALTTCSKKYNSSGFATGGINCTVK
jgi:hypothetical protein